MPKSPRWLILGLGMLLLQQAALAAQTCKYDSIPATAPESRFTDNGNGTVSDTDTGLQWKHCFEGQTWDGNTCNGTASTHTWQQALQLADDATYAGRDDWHLPNVKELATIAELACASPAIDLTVFPNTVMPPRWSATPSAWWSTHAWGFGTSSGNFSDLRTKDTPSAVRLVRVEQESLLNDTGLDWWADGSTRFLDSAVPDYPGQDASYGRDVTHDEDDDGHAGFSFTKLDANGNDLPVSATEWSCVRDEVTGLTWEVKTNDGGLHDRDDTYTWYNTNLSRNGGDPGHVGDDEAACFGYDAGDPATFCNTQSYVARVNAAGWCGATDWRMPTLKELGSIVDFSRYFPAIDIDFFPRTEGAGYYWSASPSARRVARAWYVLFAYGNTADGTSRSNKDNHYPIRLVRNGQLSPENTLSVDVLPTDGGTVEGFFKADGTFAHIDCPDTQCSHSYASGDVIELHATPHDGYEFLQWTGCQPVLEYPETCDVTMDDHKNVTATFRRPLLVRCIHDPIWPQVGDTVTITVESLDYDLNQRSGLGDTMEIWIDEQADPDNPTPILEETVSGSEANIEVGPFPNPRFAYECRIRDVGGQESTTGLRTVAIGAPQSDSAPVPVVTISDPAESVDIVFHADRDNYASVQDPQWLTHLHNIIANGFYSERIFLENQRYLNFYISPVLGRAITSGAGCNHQFTPYDDADAHGVINTKPDPFRNCSRKGSDNFSANALDVRMVLHEVGHAPFGLADEYCCDSLPYGEDVMPEMPNVYGTLEACIEDAPNVGRPAEEDTCRSWTTTKSKGWWIFKETEDWYTSDPENNDLMVDRQEPQALDLRRIQWYFDNCINNPDC